MARNKRRGTTRPPASGAPASARRSPPDWPMFVIALLGVAVTGILIWNSMTAAALPYCAAGSGCDLVQSSAWSRFLGVPLAVWGLLTYIVLASLACGGRIQARARWLALVATFGFGVSVYLTIVSLTLIEATCIYCLASLALMTAALGVSWRPRSLDTRRFRTAGVVLAVLTAGMMHADAQGLFGKGAGTVDPYLRALAMHLDQRGVRFYGAYWCPHCEEQKAVFGAAARYLPYVECAPHGPRGPRATTCEQLEIKAYPTWIIDDRRIERPLTAAALARLSGFRPPPDATP